MMNPNLCVTINSTDQSETGTTGISINLTDCTQGNYNNGNINQDWVFENISDYCTIHMDLSGDVTCDPLPVP